MATNSSFADNFYQTATYIYNNFILHNRINSFTTKKHDFITSSIAYLTEECAMVYPKDLGKALHQDMNTFLGSQRNILQPLQIRFKKITSLTNPSVSIA